MADNSGEIGTITIWLNTFIPRDLEKMTLPVPAQSAHAGKTMLPGPIPTRRCYLTDQRGFCSDKDASSRMHSEIEIDMREGRLARQFHHCHPTIEIDCETGEVSCEQTGETSDMDFSNFDVSANRLNVQVELKGSSRNPCFRVATFQIAPKVDYVGTVGIKLDNNRRSALVWFRGRVEVYPSFEMYASANDGSARTIFQLDTLFGTSPADLFGPPSRDVYGEVTLSV